MGIGRILNGEISTGDQVAYGKPDEPVKKGDYDDMMMMMMMIDIISIIIMMIYNTCTIKKVKSESCLYSTMWVVIKWTPRKQVGGWTSSTSCCC